MYKFLKKIMVWGSCLLLLINVVSIVCLVTLANSNFYKPSFVNNLEPKTYDYIVLGSSTGLTTINTKLLDKSTGLNGVNLSMDDTALPTHYLMLNHILSKGIKTDNLILSVTPWDLKNNNPEIGNNDYRFLPFIHEDYVYNHFKKISNKPLNKFNLSYYLPFYAFSYYNTELFPPSLVALLDSKFRNRFDDKGNYVYPNSNFSHKPVSQTAYQLEINNPYIAKIAKICKANDIKLILYQSPIYKAEYKEVNTNYIFVNAIDLLSKSKYFYDRIHVNKKGRKLTTLSLAKVLKNKTY
jgi:hypothetical protein